MILRPVVFVLSAVMFFLHAHAFAQERGIEIFAGAGYVWDDGEGPNVPAVTGGAVAWLTRGWGIGARITEGVGTDDFDEPIGRTVGVGDLRIWALTSQWRWFARGTEVHVGLGAGGHGYRHQLMPGDVMRDRTGSGFVAIDLLVGRQLAGPVHMKGGFLYGLGGDANAFQPLVLIAWKM